ncbi:MAG TPA: permease [Solirubrobacteraceae bacterium]|nr:permease [Solirubrobacteraceae bacterium]
MGSTHVWSGKDILAKAGQAGAAPSLAGAWHFTRAYLAAIWMALVAALVIASAVQALVPRSWLLAPARRGGQMRRSAIGGAASLPCLMCTCCSAPVAVTLRREGAPRSTVLAYWMGNPVLNPVVLAFLALVCPWQWVATRILVGALLVFGATALVARITGERSEELPALDSAGLELRGAPARFGGALLRLSTTLLPEYLLVVFVLGLFRGWIFPLGASASHSEVLALLIAAGLGTLVVIPTTGEIPILLGLSALGVGAAPIGALLITLPAISLVSMMLVMRALSARVTVAMAGAVAASGILAGALLSLLG